MVENDNHPNSTPRGCQPAPCDTLSGVSAPGSGICTNIENSSNMSGRKEGSVLFNDALNTFYLRLYGVRHMVKTILIVRKETRCRHMGYSYRLTARVLLYAPSHRQDSTYHSLCYASRGALAGTRNSSMGPPNEGSIQWPIAPWANALTMELHLALIICQRQKSHWHT